MTPFDKNEISVYIHIPFCIQARKGEPNLVVSSNRQSRNMYLEALDRELMSAGDILEGRRIASIYVGGGAATVVSPDRLGRLLLKFRRTYDVIPSAELTLTAAPETLITPCLTGLNICNFNRISVLAYSPVDNLLSQIGASHRLGNLENGTLLLSAMGFSNIDAVLLYGIPGQTKGILKNTLVSFTSLKGLKHISLQRYELSEQEGVSFDESLEQYTFAAEVLAERGMCHYAAGCFGREDRRWQYQYHDLMGMERIGFGLGARTSIDNMIYQNTTDMASYLQNSSDFTKLITAVVELDLPTQMKRFMALRLQLVDGFTFQEITDEFGCPLDSSLPPLLDDLETNGLVNRTEQNVKPTMKGLVCASEIISRLLG